MSPWNSLKPSTGHFDVVGGVFTLSGLKHAPMDRANTSQWAMASVRSSGDSFKMTTGEKIFIGVFLLIGVLAGFMTLVSWACGLNGYWKKVFAQSIFWFSFLVFVLFVVVFLAKTFWNWLP